MIHNLGVVSCPWFAHMRATDNIGSLEVWRGGALNFAQPLGKWYSLGCIGLLFRETRYCSEIVGQGLRPPHFPKASCGNALRHK